MSRLAPPTNPAAAWLMNPLSEPATVRLPQLTASSGFGPKDGPTGGSPIFAPSPQFLTKLV